MSEKCQCKNTDCPSCMFPEPDNEALPPVAGSAPPVVTLYPQDWNDLCDVMRELTWGKNCADKWWPLYKRVVERAVQQNAEVCQPEGAKKL